MGFVRNDSAWRLGADATPPNGGTACWQFENEPLVRLRKEEGVARGGLGKNMRNNSLRRDVLRRIQHEHMRNTKISLGATDAYRVLSQSLPE
jgi:hypothetical protein